MPTDDEVKTALKVLQHMMLVYQSFRDSEKPFSGSWKTYGKKADVYEAAFIQLTADP